MHILFKTMQDLLAILFEIEIQIYIPLKQNKRWIARKYVTHFSSTSITYFLEYFDLFERCRAFNQEEGRPRDKERLFTKNTTTINNK